MSFVAIFSDASEVDDPFQWKPQENLESVPDDMIGRLSLKIEEESSEGEIEEERIILHLALSFEHFIAGNVPKSTEILQNMIDQTTRLGELKESGSNPHRLLALQHLLLSALTHVSIYLKNIENARQEMDKIARISTMNSKSRAALNGFRATFYAEYGIYGSRAAIAYAARAIEMDAEESLWYFLKGKLLGRVRHVEKPFDIPSPEELDALETASEKETKAAYAIFTAQVYRETASRAFIKHSNERTLHPNLKKMIDTMNFKSYQLYEKSLSLKPLCPRIKFRCAKGFMSLPPPHKNTALAKRCIVDGLKMAPKSAFGNHAMAMFYERYEKDIDSAVKHLKICVAMRVFGAAIDLLRLEISHYRLSGTDILERLDKLYADFVETPRRCQILSHYVSYYLFERDGYALEKAIKYLIDVFRLNPLCEDVHRHRSLFLRLRQPISLLEVVVDETKIRLDDENCSGRTRVICNQFLADLADLNVAYARNRPRHLRQTYLYSNPNPNPNGNGNGRNGDSAKRASRGGRPRKGEARGRSSVNATLSYVQRRDQQAAVDETLQKIDHFTNSWKEELQWRSSANADGDESPLNPARRAGDEDDDDGNDSSSSTDSRVRHLAETREKGERVGRPPPPAASQPSLDQQRPSFAGLTISAGPSDENDLDFEKSVLAYRRAKQAVGCARPLHDQTPSSTSRPQSRRSHPRTDPSRSASPPPTDALAKSSRSKPKKKINGDDVFDNYLADRSTDEMTKKFQPEELRF